MDNTPFLKKNQIPIPNTFELAVCKRFVDKEGKPVMWKFHKLETHFERELRKKCQQPSTISLIGIGQAKFTTDKSKLWLMRLAEACVYPNLDDEQLQKDHNANNKYELLEILVSDNEEYSNLIIEYFNHFMKGGATVG